MVALRCYWRSSLDCRSNKFSLIGQNKEHDEKHFEHLPHSYSLMEKNYK
jgi:hypothetical protein